METKKKQYVKPEVRKHKVISKRLLCRAGIIILTFALAGCKNNQAQVVIKNNTGSNDTLYNKVCNYVCRELDIDSIEVIISHIAFDKGIYWTEGGLASVHGYSPTIFGINIFQNPNKKQLVKSIIHELYHVKQILDKRLWISARANWFEGKLYTAANSDYYERPYEIEAENFARQFYKEHKKEFKAMIQNK